MKKWLAILVSMLLLATMIPMGAVSVGAASFSPRLTAPSKTGYYGIQSSMNPFRVNTSAGGGNCTWYAWGRAYEILGSRPKLSTGNACTWYPNNQSNGNYPYGSEPKQGAIICWSGGSSGAGHVAVVEQIHSNGTITISESSWTATSWWFRTKTLSKYGDYGGSLTFQGYIYILDGAPNSHKVDSSYGKNFTAYPKAKITASNIFDANHNQIGPNSWIGTSDKCTIHEVYTDGCCKVTYPLDAGGTTTVYSKIALFDLDHTCNKGQYMYYEAAHPHYSCYKCSICGNVWRNTAEPNNVSTCSECNPPHAETPTIKWWLSDSEYGDAVDGCKVGNRYYFCYRLYDSVTGKDWDEVSSNNYTVNIAVYNPDGSLNYDSTKSSDTGWISIFYTTAGTYTRKVVVDGDFLFEGSREFYVAPNPKTVHTSTNSISLNLNGSKSQTIYVWSSGYYSGNANWSWSSSNSNISCTWGEWTEDNRLPLTVNANSVGTSTLTLSLKDRETGAVLDSASIPVTINVNAAALSVNSSNSATISSGGTIKYFTYTPTTSGKYVIYSTSSDDTKVYLYNENWTELAYNDDGGEASNFRLEYNLTAGTKYNFGVKYYDSSKTGTISFKFGNVYTITYNANGGSGAPSAQSKDYGTTITLSNTKPIRTGYTFLGWSTSSSAVSHSYSSGSQYTGNSNVVLYAVWEKGCAGSHDYYNYVSKQATCGSDGVRTYVCNDCQQSYTNPIPATGKHTYDNTCDTICNTCGATRSIQHSYAAATCTKPEICTVCGKTQGTALGHKYDNACDTICNTCGATRSIKHSYSAATCTKPEICTVCGHTQGSALGHKYDNACDTTCNTCGATRSIKHSYAAATCTKPETCTVCGHTQGTALGHKYDDDYDADCNVCGAVREVPEKPPVIPNLPADAPAFVVESTSARAGQEFTVAIRTQRNSGIISLKLNVAYDADVLELVEAVEKDFAGASFGPLTATPFVVNWFNALRPDNTTNGVVALLTFRVKEGAPIGKTDITLSYDPMDVFDQNYDNVAFRTEDGFVEIVDYMLGDATGDGAVNNRDLAMMQQFINGWEVVVDEDACDVNVDGAINNRDLALLQQYINGWDVTLGK